jgi:hypothetical protein
MTSYAQFQVHDRRLSLETIYQAGFRRALYGESTRRRYVFAVDRAAWDAGVRAGKAELKQMHESIFEWVSRSHSGSPMSVGSNA